MSLRLGCNPKTIASWENGATENPEPGLFLEFARATGADIAWLYDGEGPDDAADHNADPGRTKPVDGEG